MVICGIIYFSVFYGKFYVSAVEITGNNGVLAQDISQKALQAANTPLINAGLLRIYSKSIIIARKGAIEDNILQAFPEIDSVNVKKQFPNKILVQVKERVAFANACENQQCFLMDSKGILFKEAFQEDLISITNEAGLAPLALRATTISRQAIEFIDAISKNLRERFNVTAKSAIVADTLVITTNEGWQAHFSMQETAEPQITKMNLLLEQEIVPAQRKNIEYIYLQYQDKAYYK